MTVMTRATLRALQDRPARLDRRLVIRVLTLYLLVRIFSTAVLAWASTKQVPFDPWTGPDPGLLDMSVLWDGSWYRSIAEDGYPRFVPVGPDGYVVQNGWAFYPVFPLLARVVMGFGLDFPVAGTLVALASGAGAAVAIAAIFRRIAPPAAVLAAVTVWAACPPSPTMQIAYSDATAILILALALWALIEQRWLTTAGLVLVMGLTRPIAAPFLVVVGVSLLARWLGRREAWSRRRYVEAATLVVANLIATFEWSWIAARVTGEPNAYFVSMAAWRIDHQIHFFSGWRFWSAWILSDTRHPYGYGFILLVVMVAVLLLIPLGPWAGRLGVELRTWLLAYPAYLAVVLDPSTSVWRYGLPLFPAALVLVGGAGLTAGRWSRRRTILFLVAGLVLQVAWVTKLLVIHPPADFPP